MGTGVAKGDNRGLVAVKKAINSPLINKPISGATGVIINIVADENFPLLDAESAADYIQGSACGDADVIFGLVYDESLKDEVSVTVIATGFEKSYKVKSTGSIFRTPLRVVDSLKYYPPVQKETGREPQPVAAESEPVEMAEEIEIPYFMRRR